MAEGYCLGSDTQLCEVLGEWCPTEPMRAGSFLGPGETWQAPDTALSRKHTQCIFLSLLCRGLTGYLELYL